MDVETIEKDEIVPMTSKPTPTKITGIGARLKAARKAASLTEKEAAARLYLNVSLIFIMENEDFENAPPAMFMRGYLRSYARLLNISDSDINAALNELENTMPSNYTPTPAPLLKITALRPHDRYLHWMTYLVIFILIALVSIWWSSHSRETVTNLPASTAPLMTAPSTDIALPPPPVETPAIPATTSSSSPAPIISGAPSTTPPALAKPPEDSPVPEIKSESPPLQMAAPEEPGLDSSD